MHDADEHRPGEGETAPNPPPPPPNGGGGSGGFWERCEDSPAHPPEPSNYEVIHRIGAGGFGEVWLSRNRYTQHFCAVKFLSPERRREVDGLALLKQRAGEHPHVLPIEDVGEVEGRIYAVMPLAENANGHVISAESPEYYRPLTLATRQARSGVMPPEEVARIGADLGSALIHLHGRGLVHGDIKPDNVVRHDGRWRLADYGLVSAIDRSEKKRGFTPGFCPPEGPGSPEADQYALGMLLLNLLTNKPAQRIAEDMAALRQGAGTTKEAALWRVAGRALERDPERRWPSMLEFARRLERVGGAGKGRRALVAGGAAAALLLAVAGGVWLNSGAGAASPGAPIGGESAGATADPAPPAALSARIVDLRVEHIRPGPTAEEDVLLGGLGADGTPLVEGDAVRILVDFSVPAHCAVIAFETDGETRVVHPRSDAGGGPTPRLVFPSPTGFYQFTSDGPGLHAFAVIASRDSTPAMEEALSAIDWSSVVDSASGEAIAEAPGARLWALGDGGGSEAAGGVIDYTLAVATAPRDRGRIVEREPVPEALQAIAKRLSETPGVESFRVVGVIVAPRKDIGEG